MPCQSISFLGSAFGLEFASNEPLTEFVAVEAGTVRAPDACIEWHAPRPQQRVIADKPFSWQRGVFELSVPDVSDFAITATRIDIHPAPGVATSAVRAYLLGSAIGALLHLRGRLVFHGSAVRLPGGSAAMFCGHSTAGKSTLTATLTQHGHAALADDLSAVEPDPAGRPLCLPGLARTKLWRDALDRLGWSGQAQTDARVMPNIDKYCLKVPTAQEPAPLSRIYEIRVDESSQAHLAMTPVVGVEKITAMLSHIYRPGYLQAMERQSHLLAAVAKLAPQVQMTRISRPRRGDTLAAIVDGLHLQWAGARP